MNSDRVIADAIKSAQRLLWHRYDLPDAMKVVRLRTFVRSPTVQSAMQHCSDTLLAFTLRAVELVIADQSRTDREMIRRLCDILNNPHLIQTVGPQSNGMAEAFVRTIKRDYVRVSPCPDAKTVMHQLSAWINHYNEVHPHKALGYRSPREFIAAHGSP